MYYPSIATLIMYCDVYLQKQVFVQPGDSEINGCANKFTTLFAEEIWYVTSHWYSGVHRWWLQFSQSRIEAAASRARSSIKVPRGILRVKPATYSFISFCAMRNHVTLHRLASTQIRFSVTLRLVLHPAALRSPPVLSGAPLVPTGSLAGGRGAALPPVRDGPGGRSVPIAAL